MNFYKCLSLALLVSFPVAQLSAMEIEENEQVNTFSSSSTRSIDEVYDSEKDRDGLVEVKRRRGFAGTDSLDCPIMEGLNGSNVSDSDPMDIQEQHRSMVDERTSRQRREAMRRREATAHELDEQDRQEALERAEKRKIEEMEKKRHREEQELVEYQFRVGNACRINNITPYQQAINNKIVAAAKYMQKQFRY